MYEVATKTMTTHTKTALVDCFTSERCSAKIGEDFAGMKFRYLDYILDAAGIHVVLLPHRKYGKYDDQR